MFRKKWKKKSKNNDSSKGVTTTFNKNWKRNLPI